MRCFVPHSARCFAVRSESVLLVLCPQTSARVSAVMLSSGWDSPAASSLARSESLPKSATASVLAIRIGSNRLSVAAITNNASSSMCSPRVSSSSSGRTAMEPFRHLGREPEGAVHHRRVPRPWGSVSVPRTSSRSASKKITLSPIHATRNRAPRCQQTMPPSTSGASGVEHLGGEVATQYRRPLGALPMSACACGRPACLSALLDHRSRAMPTVSPVWAGCGPTRSTALPAAKWRCRWSRPRAGQSMLRGPADRRANPTHTGRGRGPSGP